MHATFGIPTSPSTALSACRAGVQRPIKFATVVTDLTTCHNTWFHKDVDRCFVATEEAKQRALTMGIGQHKVTVHGLPIRPSFSQKLPAKRKLRQQLGMDLQKPAVLLVGTVTFSPGHTSVVYSSCMSCPQTAGDKLHA